MIAPRSTTGIRGLARRARRAALALLVAVAVVNLALPPAPALGVRRAADEDGGPRAVSAVRQADRVAVLPVRGIIDRITLHSLEGRIARARTDGANAIVLEIDTPGGEMTATLDICNLLKDRSATPPNVVAWIHPQAYSAGTIIALACREIVVAPNGSFGDAAPVRVSGLPGGGLVAIPPAERAKMEAPLLAEVIDSARRNHYDENLVQAFVSVGLELWMLRDRDTGALVFVDANEYRAVFDEAPIAQLAPLTPATGVASRVTPRFGSSEQREELAAADLAESEWSEAELRQQIAFQQQLPPSRNTLGPADAARYDVLGQVVASDRLLTVKAPEAIEYGLAAAVVRNDADLRDFFGAATVVRLEAPWSEGLVRLLVSWPVRIVLIAVFLVGLFVEMAAPGMSVFGLAAGGALLLLIGAPALAGLAQWWDVLLIVVGVLLVAVELFLIPGTTIAGFIGAACLLTGLVGTFVSGDLGTAAGQRELLTGILSTIAAVGGAIGMIWVLARNVETFPRLERLVLRAEIAPGNEAGLLAAIVPGGAADRPTVGAHGTAETDLRPAGRARIGGRLWDVSAPGRYVARGRPVRVVRSDGFEIEVEEDADA